MTKCPDNKPTDIRIWSSIITGTLSVKKMLQFHITIIVGTHVALVNEKAQFENKTGGTNCYEIMCTSTTGPWLNIKTPPWSYKNSNYKDKRSHDPPIFIMGIPYMERWFYIETGHWCSSDCWQVDKSPSLAMKPWKFTYRFLMSVTRPSCENGNDWIRMPTWLRLNW